MVYIAIPTITPRLARCAIDAVERTTPEPHRIIVVEGGTHGDNLDYAFSRLPADAEWFFTMDDDAAPLRVGWLSWLLGEAGHHPWASFWRNARRLPHPLGTLYRVSWLRSLPHTTFRAMDDYDVGEYLAMNPGRGVFASPCDRRLLPWWLATCDVAADDEGRPIFAHLGGGTIGHTWYHRGRLYPRIPTWLWPIMVRRHLHALAA